MQEGLVFARVQVISHGLVYFLLMVTLIYTALMTEENNQSVTWRQHTETHQKPYQRIVHSSTQFICCITDIIVDGELCSLDCLRIRHDADVVSMSALRSKCPYLCWLVFSFFFSLWFSTPQADVDFVFLLSFCAEQLSLRQQNAPLWRMWMSVFLNERFRFPSG